MGTCAWCRREKATEKVFFSYGQLDQVALDPMCARLLAPGFYLSELHEDDLNVLDVARSALDRRLTALYASGAASADRCWWCGRPGAPWDCALHEASALLFEQPVLCDICVGLSGHVGGGFADVDTAWQAAYMRALGTLDREAAPPKPTLREAHEALLLVKLALLEHEAKHGFVDYPDDGFAELAASLGLAEAEACAQILRLWEVPDSPVAFARFDDGVVPVLSVVGWQAVRDLQEGRGGTPHLATLRRALRRLNELAVPS